MSITLNNSVSNSRLTSPQSSVKFGKRERVEYEDSQCQVVVREKKDYNPAVKTAFKIAAAILAPAAIVAGIVALQRKGQGLTRKAVKEALSKIYEANGKEMPKKFSQAVKDVHINPAVAAKHPEHVETIQKFQMHKDATRNSIMESIKFSAIWEGVSMLLGGLF